ncbi:helix-turn-helix transcriptional regulator [Psychromarinibacter halotolerans]|uniref:Helix-turn-helix transcriptional regulator n=1 Tax=Psychromarinibacter halotolerans TaxID=1775175 RepID=A0ABV7GT82_9RHOB|nr:WYL domain-containing protein [Psychromarinibacter halotolerans]MDF0596970.1 HTH domain-containing protein [Psychromarinibacter halotolerans]
MSRSDRLYALIQSLRDGRLHRASELAKTHGVSERTIWRDMDTLMASGVPVRGERGLGYRMTAPVTLPPLNLSMTELEALHVGLAAVAHGGDAELSAAARKLSGRIDTLLPEDRTGARGGWTFAVHPLADAAAGFAHMPRIRAAIRSRQKLAAHHQEDDASLQRRVIRPLKLDYWGRVWTVACWCETTGGFATLRVDRIAQLDILPALFVEEQGKTLVDFNHAQG